MSERETGAERSPRIVCVVGRSPSAALLPEVVATVLPGAVVSTVDTAAVRSLPDAECVVIDAEVNGDAGVTVLRQLRARGFAGLALLVADEIHDADRSAALALGAADLVERRSLVTELPLAVSRLADADDAATRSLVDALRRAQRLAAAGEIAFGLQHSLNNPLAALMAEAQLLELETMEREHQEAVHRMVELCRRMVDELRRLDGVGRS